MSHKPTEHPSPPSIPFLDTLIVFLRTDSPREIGAEIRATPKKIQFRQHDLPFDPENLSGRGNAKLLARESCLRGVRKYVWDLQCRTPFPTPSGERRSSDRVSCDLSLHVLEPSRGSLRVRNLSSLGALLVSLVVFPVGLKIRCMMVLRSQGTVRDSLVLNARVLRSHLPEPLGKEFLLGIQFIDTNPGTLEALKQFLQELRGTKNP